MYLLDGVTPELARACLAVMVFGVLIAWHDLSLRWAIFVTCVKIAFPLFYFAHNGFGAIHLSDDLEYYYAMIALYQQGFSAAAFLVAPDGLNLLIDAVGGRHIVYPFWNLASFSLFGPYYFSPVLLNVGATFVAGWLFARILERLDFAAGYRMAALVFFLLHWEVVVWSSLLNLKDILVMTMTLAALHAFILLFERPRLMLFLWIAALLAILSYLRFYVPLFVVVAAVFHFIRERGAGDRMTALLVILFAVGILAFWNARFVLEALGWLRPDEILWGLPRFFLTPLPWKLTPRAGYLFIPSLLHLLLIVPALAAVPFLWARGSAARFMLTYGALVMLLYAVTPDLQGVRHRAQVAFLFAWLQFHALWMLVHIALPHRVSAGETGQGITARDGERVGRSAPP